MLATQNQMINDNRGVFTPKHPKKRGPHCTGKTGYKCLKKSVWENTGNLKVIAIFAPKFPN